MTDVSFQNGDRIKVTFEATVVDAAGTGRFDYIELDNGNGLEFPSEYVGESVTIEKIKKPLKVGWWEVNFKASPGLVDVKWRGDNDWYHSPSDIGSYALVSGLLPVKYLGRGSLE